MLECNQGIPFILIHVPFHVAYSLPIMMRHVFAWQTHLVRVFLHPIELPGGRVMYPIW